MGTRLREAREALLRLAKRISDRELRAAVADLDDGRYGPALARLRGLDFRHYELTAAEETLAAAL